MDGEVILHELDLDNFQFVLYPDQSRIVLNLSGNDLAAIRELAPVVERTITGPAASQPEDAERLERLRKWYEVKPVAIFDGEVGERFLLRMIDARDAEIIRLHELLQEGENDLYVVDQKLYAAREEIDRLRAEIESERDARQKCDAALRAKDEAMSILFSRLRNARIDCSDLFS
jgi:hypothetical protein